MLLVCGGSGAEAPWQINGAERVASSGESEFGSDTLLPLSGHDKQQQEFVALASIFCGARMYKKQGGFCLRPESYQEAQVAHQPHANVTSSSHLCKVEKCRLHCDSLERLEVFRETVLPHRMRLQLFQTAVRVSWCAEVWLLGNPQLGHCGRGRLGLFNLGAGVLVQWIFILNVYS